MNFSLDRDGKRDNKNLHIHIWNLILILFSCHSLFYCMVWKCFTALPLLRSAPSISRRSVVHFSRFVDIQLRVIFTICAAVPSCQQKYETILGDEFFTSASQWHCLHIRTCRVVWLFFNDVHYLFRLVHAWNIRKSECKHSHIWMTLMRFQYNSRPILPIFNEFSDIFVWV